MSEKPFINLNNETGYGSRLKKPIIITLAVIVVMVIAAILVVVLTPKTNPSDKKDNTPAYDKTASFTKMQKLFTQLCGKEIVVEFIAEQYFKKNGDYDVSTFANHTGQISLKGPSTSPTTKQSTKKTHSSSSQARIPTSTIMAPSPTNSTTSKTPS